ncbi:hypothetical protein BC835DRAFT_1363563 [Cytidiella melzeri]|nr:hypothetical protein BC835DRAFT_1363563 [Cytidiella melzeri]
MRFSTSIFVFAAITSGTFHMVTVSATPLSRTAFRGYPPSSVNINIFKGQGGAFSKPFKPIAPSESKHFSPNTPLSVVPAPYKKQVIKPPPPFDKKSWVEFLTLQTQVVEEMLGGKRHADPNDSQDVKDYYKYYESKASMRELKVPQAS